MRKTESGGRRRIMGRGSSKAGGSGNPNAALLKSLTDNEDFREWLRENKGNAEFMAFGREYGTEGAKELWREKRTEAELKNVHEMSQEDAVEMIRDGIPAQTMHNWFIEANSDIKPKLVDYILGQKGMLNATLNVAYSNYKADLELKSIREGKKIEPMGFQKWLNTPQTMYRGEHGQTHVKSDIFLSFTPDINIAKKFGGKITMYAAQEFPLYVVTLTVCYAI